MPIYEINPLKDHRWAAFLENHPSASVFHTAAWLEALRRTYGYEPIAFTTSSPDRDLENAVVFCQIKSWLTGSRLVSLPFSDHCEPLVEDPADRQTLFNELERQFHRRNWRYMEIRPLRSLNPEGGVFHEDQTYCFHQLDLSPELDALFRNFHKDSTQRKIRRAEREGLRVEEGQSESLLEAFYSLQLLTRRRHQVPPQPRKWFLSLIDCFGDDLQIRLASKNGQPTAAILTIRFKDKLVYKYGCSNSEFNNLGGTQLLFWRSIQEAKKSGQRLFDLGRSDTDNEGLLVFKDRLGAERSTLTYARYPASKIHSPAADWKLQTTKHIFAYVPDTLLPILGNLLYRHIG